VRYVVLLKSTQQPTTPPPGLMEAIMKLGEEATRSGAMLDTAGLAPSAAGARVTLTGGALSVTDGPFAEAKEWLGGYFLLECDAATALEFAERCPTARDGFVEVRQVLET